MGVIDEYLEKACKNMIRTILFCLENATKGTIYRVGPKPELETVRITSGIRMQGGDEIRWGLPTSSDYNYPGKKWEQYKDRPGHVLESMGWCVERQQSWTADNPYEDIRSVEKQLRGEIEDSYHMEPVLVRTTDLHPEAERDVEYPMDWRGIPIWQGSPFEVVAVIKIHFRPGTLKKQDRSTKIIHELSRSLGTELLSLKLREGLSIAQKEFTRQRLQSCEILAHELRNTLIRFGFIFTAVNAQIALLREEWEDQVAKTFPELDWKRRILERLDEILRRRLPLLKGSPELISLAKTVAAEQEEIRRTSLLPAQAEVWLHNKILPKWHRLLGESGAWHEERVEIEGLLKRLGASLVLGADPGLAMKMTPLPEDLTRNWQRLAYTHFTAESLPALEDILELLEHPALPVPHKRQVARGIRALKVLIEVLPDVEERANRIIKFLRHGTLTESEAVQELERVCNRTNLPDLLNDCRTMV
jgi:hypothetical protein